MAVQPQLQSGRAATYGEETPRIGAHERSIMYIGAMAGRMEGPVQKDPLAANGKLSVGYKRLDACNPLNKGRRRMLGDFQPLAVCEAADNSD